MTDDELLDRLITREGRRYVEHPADRGGCSKFGLTRETLAQWRHGAFPVTCADVRALTEAEARRIYRALFLAPFASVTDGETKEVLVDSAVLHGLGRTVRWVQEALGVEVDGIIGPETRGALARADLVELGRAILRARLRLVGELVTRDYATRSQRIAQRLAQGGDPLVLAADIVATLAGGQAANCAGWLARLASVV